MDKERHAYWKAHYSDPSVVGSEFPQKNVERTRGGVPINKECWEQTLEYIQKTIAMKESDTIIEFCCGNGMVIGPLSSKCSRAIGIDYSEELLRQLNQLFPDCVETILSDIMDVNLEDDFADIVVINFSIQLFNDADAVRIIEKAFKPLKRGGRLYVGDIPNDLKKWDYIDRPEYRKDYIERLLENRPMIGNWFQPDFFSAVACYLGNASVEILEQPEYLINSSCRYDVLFTKL